MAHRELLKSIIEKLTGVLADLDGVKTCSRCSKSAISRGFCGTHYGRWRREYCRERQVKNIRDVSKVYEPDPRQREIPF